MEPHHFDMLMRKIHSENKTTKSTNFGVQFGIGHVLNPWFSFSQHHHELYANKNAVQETRGSRISAPCLFKSQGSKSKFTHHLTVWFPEKNPNKSPNISPKMRSPWAVLLLLQLIVLSFEVLPFGLNKFRYVDIPGFSGFVWPAYSSNRNSIQSRFGILIYKSYHPNSQDRIFPIYSFQFCHLKKTFHTSPIKSLQQISKSWISVRPPM